MGKKKQPRSKIRKLSSESDHALITTAAPIIDRLSALPDDIICHILSFLPTKKSVRTSILAKKWRSTWARVPSLHFDGNDYSREGSSMSYIINRVMLLRIKGVNINTFYLNHMGESCISFEFETWILILIAHNVQTMDICLGYQFNLPRCLFSCKTLVDLRLRYCSVASISDPDIDGFPSLKKLRLDSISYESGSSLAHLLSGCPVLEELIINTESSRNALICCDVSSPTLKRLDINSNFTCIEKEWYEVVLNTPALTYLKLHDFVSYYFSSGALNSLEEADVDFGEERDDILYSPSVLEFVGAIKNVKCLRLSTCVMEVDDSAFSEVLSAIKFHNLTNLVLEADRRFISFFLENAENLRVLDVCIVDGKIKYWMEPDEVPNCVSRHLRKVIIRGFRFTVGEFELVRYFFRNAKVMKCMEIYLEQINEEDVKLDAVKRISKYQQGFEACELVFR